MTETYKPTGGLVLSENKTRPQIRLGIQSPPKSGKTWSALTFPNPVVLNLDRGLGAHGHRTDVIEIPMWDGTFVQTIIPKVGVNAPVNRKDAVLKWLHNEGTKLTSAQTLVVDGLTGLQNAFSIQYAFAPVYTKLLKLDDFAEWRLKVEYFGELCEFLKGLKCDVVFLCHETPDRNKDGELNGMVRPLLTGQFSDQLASHFTDFFRALTVAKPSADRVDMFLKKYNIDKPTLDKWVKSNDTDTIYLWQTQSDDVVKCGTSTLTKAPKYILQDYNSFVAFGKK